MSQGVAKRLLWFERPRAVLALSVVAMATAVVVRVASLGAKPFWRDEAWVAWLIELPEPVLATVRYVLPAGFLALERAIAARSSGMAPEIAYRLLPLACGLAAVALLPALARRLGASPPVALASLWLAAGMPPLVYYSRELKPYAIDLLWSVVVPLMALELAALGAPRSRRAVALRSLLLLLLVAATPWLAYGAVFPVVAGLAWLGGRFVGERRSRRLPVFVISAAILLASLSAAYLAFLGDQLSNRFVHEMWEAETGAPPGLTAADVLRALLGVHSVALSYLFQGLWLPAVAMVLLGIVAWPAAGRAPLLWSWLGAGTLAGAASLFHLWVLEHGRFLLFLAPPLILLAAAGLVRTGEWMGERLRSGGGPWIGVALAAAAGIAWSAQALAHRWRPATSDPGRYFVFDVLQDIDPLIARLETARVPPSLVMVSRYAGDGFRYYRRGRLPGAHVSTMVDRDRRRALDDWLVSVRDEGWLILCDEETRGGTRQALKLRGFDVVEVARSRGALLWRITRAPPPHTPPEPHPGAASVGRSSGTRRTA